MYEVKAGPITPAGKPDGCISRGGAIAIGLFGLLVFSIGLAICWPSFRAADWPTAPGTVLDSTVQTSRTSKGGSTHRCRVHYWFAFNGSQYTGDRLDMMSVSASGNGAFEDQKRYPPGAACEVHYNPDSPFENCLRPGPGTFQWTFLWIGFGIIAVAVVIGVSAWWQKGVPSLR